MASGSRPLYQQDTLVAPLQQPSLHPHRQWPLLLQQQRLRLPSLVVPLEALHTLTRTCIRYPVWHLLLLLLLLRWCPRSTVLLLPSRLR